jgi:hypothetical protein
MDNAAGEYLFDADAQGRPIIAEGWVIKRDGVRNPAVNREVTRGLRRFHAGHLIPNTFNGPSIRDNLVPMPEVMNLSYVKAVENMVGRHLQNGPVYLKVGVEYSGDSKVPDVIRHRIYRLGEQGMEMLPAGDITTNLGAMPSTAMGKVTLPRDFLSADPAKGVITETPQ